MSSEHALDKVILLWTANTERFADIIPGLNDTAENLMRSIKNDASEVSPSTLFAVASILEGVFEQRRMFANILIINNRYCVTLIVRIYQWIAPKHVCSRLYWNGREG